MTPPGGDVSAEMVSCLEHLGNQEMKRGERERERGADSHEDREEGVRVCLLYTLHGAHMHHVVREHKAYENRWWVLFATFSQFSFLTDCSQE